MTNMDREPSQGLPCRPFLSLEIFVAFQFLLYSGDVVYTTQNLLFTEELINTIIFYPARYQNVQMHVFCTSPASSNTGINIYLFNPFIKIELFL